MKLIQIGSYFTEQDRDVCTYSTCMLAHVIVFWLTSHIVVFVEQPLVFIGSTVQHSVSYRPTQHGQYHHNHADHFSQFIFLYGFVGLSQFGNLESHLYNV